MSTAREIHPPVHQATYQMAIRNLVAFIRSYGEIDFYVENVHYCLCLDEEEQELLFRRGTEITYGQDHPALPEELYRHAEQISNLMKIIQKQHECIVRALKVIGGVEENF